MRLDRIRHADDGTMIVGVALLMTSPTDAHAAVVYRQADQQPLRLLHMAFHRRFHDDPFDPKYLCFEPPINRSGQMALAGLCRRVVSVNRRGTMPYSLRYDPSDGIDPDTGEYQDNGVGLNCSTFVVHFFRSGRYPLIDTSYWEERPEDQPRQKQLVEMLHKEDAEWAYLVACEVGCARIRPEEVAGACLGDLLPVGFHDCVKRGPIVLEAARTHCGLSQ